MVCYARIVANYTDKQNLPSKNKTRETERKKTNKINPGLAFSSSSYPSVWSSCCGYCRRGLLSVPGITRCLSSLPLSPPSQSIHPSIQVGLLFPPNALHISNELNKWY